MDGQTDPREARLPIFVRRRERDASAINAPPSAAQDTETFRRSFGLESVRGTS
jgi:hypothetical protein